MVDADILGSAANAWTREYLMVGLLTHEDIECWKYGDDGPPPAIPRVMSRAGIQAVKGWVVASPQSEEGFATHSVVYMTGDDVTRTWIVGETVWAASLNDRSRAYAAMGSAEAATRRSTDALAACVAEQIKADLFVTDRAYLHEVSGKPLGRGVTYCLPAEALALVSLYLRAQGRFPTWTDPHGGSSETFNKGLFY